MALGPGKYDDLTTYVREQAQAAAVVVIVIDGNKGSGFSAQAIPEVAPKLTTLLRLLADQMEEAAPEADERLTDNDRPMRVSGGSGTNYGTDT